MSSGDRHDIKAVRDHIQFSENTCMKLGPEQGLICSVHFVHFNSMISGSKNETIFVSEVFGSLDWAPEKVLLHKEPSLFWDIFLDVKLNTI